MISIEDVVKQMNVFLPEQTAGKYKHIAQRYLDLCVSEMLEGYGRDKDPDQDLDTISIYIEDNIRKQHTHRYNKTQYWYTWLSQQFPLWIKIRNGYNNGKSNPSIVRSIVPLRELLQHRIAHSQSYLIEPVVDTGDFSVQLNQDSLINFIVAKQKLLDQNQAYNPGKEARKISQALKLLEYISVNGTSMPHVGKVSDYGRTYCSGFNLQNAVTAEVREAALGNAIKIDINSAMMVFYRTVIAEYDPGYPAHGLRALIDDKKLVRQTLADLLSNTKMSTDSKIKTVIKKSIAAIGFGSNPHSAYSSIKNIIWHQADREQFCNSEYIQLLVNDIEHFNQLTKKTFTPQYVREHFAQALKVNEKTGRSRFSRDSFNTYLYQQWESVVMNWVIQYVEQKYPGGVILQVHDCVYLHPHVSMDLLRGLQQDIQYHISPWLSFDRECISEYRNSGKYVDRDHIQRLQAEEALAKTYTGILANTTTADPYPHNAAQGQLLHLALLDGKLTREDIAVDPECEFNLQRYRNNQLLQLVQPGQSIDDEWAAVCQAHAAELNPAQ